MKIVCLIGSTRFRDAYEEANFVESMKGNVVLTVACFSGDPSSKFKVTEDGKKLVDELHLRKIDMADHVLVLNVGGYIGESTRKEIEYAKSRGCLIRYLEPV